MAVIFGPDAFTVGADQNLNTYPTGAADYEMVNGAAGDLVVNNANDRVQRPTTSGLDAIARIIDGAVPGTMGDQEIRCDGYASSTGGADSAEIAVRCGAAASGNCYLHYFNAGTLELYRMVAGALTLLTSGARTITTGSNALRYRATGTTPVALVFQIAATAELTFNDSNAARHQSGPPGIGGWNSGGANVMFVDNVVVDDLQAAGAGAFPFRRRQPHMGALLQL